MNHVEKTRKQVKETLKANKVSLTHTLKLCYRKHCKMDDTIGWDELDEIIRNCLKTALGDEEYIKFIESS